MRICEVDGCTKKAKARNLCSAHYSKLTRTGSVLGAKVEDSNRQSFQPIAPIKECSIEDCENPHLSKGLCSMHYQRQFISDTPIEVFDRKDKGLCSKCGVNPRGVSSTGKTHSWCRSCNNQARKDWETRKGGTRFIRYRLTGDDLRMMMLSQDDSCASCGDSITLETCHVDHDNSCCPKTITRSARSCGNCVRALLCGSCNQGLGNFKDSPERLRAAADYLERHNVSTEYIEK